MGRLPARAGPELRRCASEQKQQAEAEREQSDKKAFPVAEPRAGGYRIDGEAQDPADDEDRADDSDGRREKLNLAERAIGGLIKSDAVRHGPRIGRTPSGTRCEARCWRRTRTAPGPSRPRVPSLRDLSLIGSGRPGSGQEAILAPWPMPAERADGRSLLGEVISTINFRGAAPLVLFALGLVMVVIVVGTLLS